MDPTATLQRIADCVDCNDHDGFNEAVVDLRDWLAKGGFAPVVRFETFGTRILIARLPGRVIHIQSVVTDVGMIEVKPMRFELAEYDSRGDLVDRWRFA